MTEQPASPIPSPFADQVAEALRHLYDPPGLLRSPLADLLPAPGLPPEHRARFLRTALLEAIESLNPGPRVPFRSPSSRSYDALRLRYVETRTVEEVARELAVSERQAYRDIRKGESDVAAILWARHRPRHPEQAPAADQGLQAEVGRLQLRPVNTPLQPIVAEALAAVAPLARRLGCALPAAAPTPAAVSADSTALRQCLIALLSCALQSGANRTSLQVKGTPGAVCVKVRCEGAGGPTSPPPAGPWDTASALARATGARLSCAQEASGLSLELDLPAATPATVLVIDDNEGLVELFERYLADADCHVVGAQDPSEGLRLARERAPDAIVLDILMPDTDGWELLTRLKADPATAGVPVVVCSVFNDPALAQALGASAFVPKPVSRAALLSALQSLACLPSSQSR